MVLRRICIARRVDAVCVTVVFVARSGCLALGFLFLSGSSCLLYTHDINHAPTVKLMGPATTPFGSMTRPTYHADAHDPEQSAESLTYEWRSRMGLCPASDAEAFVGAPVGESKPDFQPDADFTEPFCVWVVVRDSEGAWSYAKQRTDVTHQPTIAVIEVVKPAASDGHVPLFSQVQLSGAKSRDPEAPGGKLTFAWTLTRGMETLTATACPLAPQTDICFPADKEGEYTAVLTVTDSRNGMTTAMKSVTVDPDAAPCITRTDPEFGLPTIVRDASEENTFEVQAISDDGDPFPPIDARPSTLFFKATWWLDGEDPEFPSGRRPDDNVPNPQRLVFQPMKFRTGDQVFVRMQVGDRAHNDFAACPPGKMNCALDPKRPSCFQWVTWKIDFRLSRDM